MAEKKKNGILSVINILLILLGSASCIVSFFNRDQSPLWILLSAFTLMVFALMVYYLIEDYRRPHGNLFRYVMSGYSWLFMAACLMAAKDYYDIAGLSVIALGACAVLSSYVAGRLHKIKSVSIVMGIIAVLMLTDIIFTFADGSKSGLVNDFGVISINIQWFAIMTTYYSRYKAHIEAGKKA